MTSEDHEILLNPCPRCNVKHKLIVRPFTSPTDTIDKYDQYTHFGICKRTDLTVMAIIKKNKVTYYG